MKKIFNLIVIIIFFLQVNYAFAGAEPIELCDAELDSISAAGFDINLEAVAALRQSVAAYQANLAALSGSSLSNASINNTNSANINSALGPTDITQENLACVVAGSGDINGAVLNNSNIAAVDFSQGPLMLAQSNISALVAVNGSILDSVINNINNVTINDGISGAAVNQQNISILVASTAVFDAVVNQQNLVSGAANSINSASTVTRTVSAAGLTALVGISGSLDLGQ